MISEDDVNAYAGKRLRLARNESGLSQAAVGKLVGVTFQQIQKYEWNINRISVGRCMQFADAFDIPITDFYPLRDRYYMDEATPPAAFLIIKLLSKIDPEYHDLVHELVKAFAKATNAKKG